MDGISHVSHGEIAREYLVTHPTKPTVGDITVFFCGNPADHVEVS